MHKKAGLGKTCHHRRRKGLKVRMETTCIPGMSAHFTSAMMQPKWLKMKLGGDFEIPKMSKGMDQPPPDVTLFNEGPSRTGGLQPLGGT